MASGIAALSAGIDLPDDATAASVARNWVGDALTSLGRADLVESAKLSTSEIVTNAIIHSLPPITIRLRGTKEQPRIEILDSSSLPPLVDLDIDEDLSTYGRGLTIVAATSAHWGWDRDGTQGGKTVWFVPSNEYKEAARALAGPLEGISPMDASIDGAVEVTFENLPVEKVRTMRRQFSELRRDLRLLILAHPRTFPGAALYMKMHNDLELSRRSAIGADAMETALMSGASNVDVTLHYPPEAVGVAYRVLGLIGMVDDAVPESVLLVDRPDPASTAVLIWTLRNIIDQAEGGEPLPWSDDMVRETRSA